MNDYPRQYAMARANVIGNMTQGISGAITDLATKIPEIVKQKRINEKITAAYGQIKDSFLQEMKTKGGVDEAKAIIQFRKVINPQLVMSKDLPAEARLTTLLKSAEPLQKLVDGFESKYSSKGFMEKAAAPISETRQVQAEGPPVQQGERAGEVPMEQRTIQRPMRSEEYEKGMAGLPEQARGMVPESLGKQVQQTEEIFQNPMKTYEADRDKRVKERKTNVSTMGTLDKGAGIKTAIIESNSEVEALKSKQKSLGDLIKLVGKSENMQPKQIEGGKQTDLMIEAETLAEELGIPKQLTTNKDFLGRMDDQIDRLIQKENDQQKEWDTMYNELRKRESAESKRKNAPKPPASKHPVDIAAKYQASLKDLQKQMFPNEYKIMQGEYGVEAMKKGSAIISAVDSFLTDPENRRAFAYAFPDESGKIAPWAGVEKPDESKIEEVRGKMRTLQQQWYGLSSGTEGLTAMPQDDEFETWFNQAK